MSGQGAFPDPDFIDFQSNYHQMARSNCKNIGFWFSLNNSDCKNTGFCIGLLPEHCLFACFLVAKMRTPSKPHLGNKKACKKTEFWQSPDAEPSVFTVIMVQRKPEPCVFAVTSCHLVIIRLKIDEIWVWKGSLSSRALKSSRKRFFKEQKHEIWEGSWRLREAFWRPASGGPSGSSQLKSGGLLGASWRLWGVLGLLGASRGLLGARWGLQEASWGLLGASWDIWEPPGASRGPWMHEKHVFYVFVCMSITKNLVKQGENT